MSGVAAGVNRRQGGKIWIENADSCSWVACGIAISLTQAQYVFSVTLGATESTISDRDRLLREK